MPTLFQSDFSTWLLRASWQASVLIGLVLLVQWLFRRQLAPRWRYRLWLLVLIRLALPFSAESGLSIFNLVRPNVPAKLETIVAIRPADDGRPNKSASMTHPPVAAYMNTHDATFGTESAPAPGHENEPARIALVKQYWYPAAVCLWLAGFVTFPAYLVISTLRLARIIRRKRSMTNPGVLGLLEDCKQLMDVYLPLVVIESKDIASPALYGFVRPRVLLPLGLANSFTRQELRFVFLHELAHIKRRDIAMNWLMMALQSLHWFNPLVWLAFSRMRADRELACDALVLSHTREDEAKPYGHTIIKLLEGFARPTAAPSLLGILEDKNEMKQRIGMIKQFRRNNRWSLLAFGLVTVLVLVCLTDAKNAKSNVVSGPIRAPGTASAESLQMTKPAISLPYSAKDGITMLIVDADTGNAIPHAVLNADFHLVKERRWLHVTDLLTDTNGAVRIPFPTNSYEAFFVYVNAEHHVPRLVNWGWDGSVPPPIYTMRLRTGVTIGGQVQNEEGEPIAGVKIVVRGPSFEQANVGSESYGYQNEVNWVVTDSTGHWSFDQVPADFGGFTLILDHPDFAQTTFSTDRNSRADGFLPKLAMKALWEKDAIMVLEAGETITGMVTDAQGKPVPEARVQRGLLEATADEAGHFHFHHVVPGHMWLNVTADGYTETLAKFKITNNMPEIYVRLDEAAIISGQVVDAKGRPIAGATILLGKNHYQATDNIHSSDAQGRFSFTHLPRNGGNAVLTVEAAGYAPEMRVVSTTTKTEHVKFQLAKGRLLKGLVLDSDGRPIVNADVSVLSWRDRQTLLWHERTDATGRFRWNSAPRDEMQGLIGRSYGSMQQDQSLMAFTFKAGDEEQVFTLSQGPLQTSAEK